VSILTEDTLKIRTGDHSKIQAWLKRYFYNLGYYSHTEKEVWRDRKGRNVTKGNPEYSRGNACPELVEGCSPKRGAIRLGSRSITDQSGLVGGER